MEKIKFDFSRLRGRIIEKYGNFTAFANAVGRTKSVISDKLNNKVRITAEEMVDWSRPDRLDIAPDMIHAYFLTPEVR